MRVLGTTVLLALVFASCHRKITIPKIESKSDLDAVEVSQQKVIEYNTSECFGFCPKYNFTIYDNGLLVYEALEHLEQLGVFYTWIDKSEVLGLLYFLEQNGFKTFDSEYPLDYKPTDLQIFTILVRLNEIEYIVKHRKYKSPDDLMMIDNYLNEFVNRQSLEQVFTKA